jgi:hypothetical protein
MRSTSVGQQHPQSQRPGSDVHAGAEKVSNPGTRGSCRWLQVASNLTSSRGSYSYVLAGCAPPRLVRIMERAHNAHGAENSMNAPQELNKPLELRAMDTLDRDPLAELCPGST